MNWQKMGSYKRRINKTFTGIAVVVDLLAVELAELQNTRSIKNCQHKEYQDCQSQIKRRSKCRRL
jgi:hypothetical protein